MSSEFDVLLGQRLRSRRVQLKLTQKAVGLRMGVTPQLVHKWEQAQSALYAEQLFFLARELGVEPAYFFEEIEAVDARAFAAGD